MKRPAKPHGKRARGGRSKSSERWLNRQRKDPFARQAADAGNVSRAYYKLAEIDRRFSLIHRDSWVLELGGAPGGWTRYIETRLGDGRLVVCDPKPVQAAPETHVVQGAYGEPAVAVNIQEFLGPRRLNLVLSDMAPNITGVRATDQALAMELAQLTLDAAGEWLEPGGAVVVKMFHGEGFEPFIGEMRKQFSKVRVVKPKASRPESREVYAVGQQFLANG
jgi:23S rRNA (uridine2552-2'-O)-methyltransferase